MILAIRIAILNMLIDWQFAILDNTRSLYQRTHDTISLAALRNVARRAELLAERENRRHERWIDSVLGWAGVIGCGGMVIMVALDTYAAMHGSSLIAIAMGQP